MARHHVIWRISLLFAVFLSVVAPSALATESGAGHYIIGNDAAPAAGIVPPPGLYWSNTDLYYLASASGSLKLPTAGRIATGLTGEFINSSMTGIYVPDVTLGPFTIAVGLTLPAQYMDATAMFGSRSRTDYSSWFGDMVITPAIIGWHSGTNFVQARLDIYVPTGSYRLGSLANIGMNYWTFTPSISYTRIEPSIGMNFSISAGLDFNTTNNADGYHSGTMFHGSATALKTIGTTGASVGVLFSMMEQVSNDTGGLADVLGGLRGQSFSIGPVGTYEFELGGTKVSSSLRWAPEFAVRNRLTGNALFLTFAARF